MEGHMIRSNYQLIISDYDKDLGIKLLWSIEPKTEVREELEDLRRELLRGDEVGTEHAGDFHL